MHKKISLVLITILLLVNTGCEKKEKKEVRETFKSYDYYLKHTQEMLKRFKECEAINYIPTAAEQQDCNSMYNAHGVYELRHN